MEMTKFIEAHKIEMESVSIPSRSDKDDDWHKDAFHFTCTITANGKSVTVNYSVGSGIIDRFIGDDLKSSSFRGVNGFMSRAQYKAAIAPWGKKLAYDVENAKSIRQKYGPKYKPSVADVLDSLASDAGCAENVRCFEDFADELGYDQDSRKAEAIYHACQKIAADLSKMLGETNYRELLEDVERL